MIDHRHRYNFRLPCAGGDGGKDGVALGADGQAIGGVFDVAAGENAAILQQDGGADMEMGIRRIGVFHSGAGQAEELLAMESRFMR